VRSAEGHRRQSVLRLRQDLRQEINERDQGEHDVLQIRPSDCTVVCGDELRDPGDETLHPGWDRIASIHASRLRARLRGRMRLRHGALAAVAAAHHSLRGCGCRYGQAEQDKIFGDLCKTRCHASIVAGQKLEGRGFCITLSGRQLLVTAPVNRFPPG
jgi:hypothetical protein